MLWKIALLFLLVMAVMSGVLARPKKKENAKGWLGGRSAKEKKLAAAKCPSCGGWIVAGTRCPCSDKQ